MTPERDEDVSHVWRFESNPRKWVGALVAAGVCLAVPAAAEAFCGFYVSNGSTDLYNNATQVALLRHEQTTVMSMRNNYEGPPEDFAMVVPVPVVLEEEYVKTLEDEVFDRLRTQTAPRLVEYWQQDPCPEPTRVQKRKARGIGDLSATGATAESGGKETGKSAVKVEAEFDVGEYEIVILSSEESRALDRWLRDNNYKIPEGAEKYFRPYVEKGSYFFVAKVDVSKVEFEDGEATLSPIRFHYDREDFRLPIRLGLLNSKGTQDLLVHILAKDQRYRVANRPNRTVPTNLPVDESVQSNFGGFYESLFRWTIEEDPRTVVTEYAWEAGKCDPCPPRQISADDFVTLGGDVATGLFDPDEGQTEGPTNEDEELELAGAGSLEAPTVRNVLQRYQGQLNRCYEKQLKKDSSAKGKVRVVFTIGKAGRVGDVSVASETVGGGVGACVASVVTGLRFPKPEGGEVQVQRTFVFVPSEVRTSQLGRNPMRDWVVTRLHTRYSADEIGDDLVFEQAPPITGGRGDPEGRNGAMGHHGSKRSDRNRFQGRYPILHRWSGGVDCDDPNWDRWGGSPPDGGSKSGPVTSGSRGMGGTPVPVSTKIDWLGAMESNWNALADHLRSTSRVADDEGETEE